MFGMNVQVYVDQRLMRWGLYARWSRRQQTSGRTGCAALRSWWGILMLPSGSGDPPPTPPPTACPVDVDEAQQTMRCVGVLPDDLRAVIIEGYLVGGTVDQQCEALGHISTRTYYKRRARAHVMLLGYFQDIEVGVPLPMLGTVELVAPIDEAAQIGGGDPRTAALVVQTFALAAAAGSS